MKAAKNLHFEAPELLAKCWYDCYNFRNFEARPVKNRVADKENIA